MESLLRLLNRVNRKYSERTGLGVVETSTFEKAFGFVKRIQEAVPVGW
jgi:hypothetical protein